jgi:pyruvate dehydrogenase E2 component (dihydrolipoamide acetyltransferase)
MPIKILMPALSPTMKEGKLVKWCKKEGEEISSGDVIAEVETDKATMEVEAVDEGKLVKILVPEGTQSVMVNSPIAIILEDGETEDDLKGFEINNGEDNVNKGAVVYEVEKPKQIEKNEVQQVDNNSNQKRIIATPLAKKIASDNKLDISSILGSGPRGRIVKEDILKAVSNTTTNANFKTNNTASEQPEFIEISTMRKVIAERLVESKRYIPHFYLKTDCIVDNLLEFRKQINEKIEEKVTINDLIIKASAIAISRVPGINTSWQGDKIVKYNSIDICVAVAITDGLITPIVKNANLKSISEISTEVKSLIEKAKNNSLKPNEFQGGCFTISNLGMYGITEFSAIINPPQSAILAVGAARKVPVVINDDIKIKTVVTITLSCDHRIVDGAIGAKFLNEFKKFIEEPVLMFI